MSRQSTIIMMSVLLVISRRRSHLAPATRHFSRVINIDSPAPLPISSLLPLVLPRPPGPDPVQWDWQAAIGGPLVERPSWLLRDGAESDSLLGDSSLERGLSGERSVVEWDELQN